MLDLFTAAPESLSVGKFQIRDYQRQAVEATLREWQRVDSCLLVMATGVGKSAVAGFLFRARLDYGRCLFVVHGDHLVKQTARTFRELLPHARIEIEQGQEYATEYADVVVASKDSLAKTRVRRRSGLVSECLECGDSGKVVRDLPGKRKLEKRCTNCTELTYPRLERFAADHFSTVCHDEAHRAVAAGSEKVLTHFAAAKVFGLTATPDRTDEQALGQRFEVVSFEFPILDAICAGWLVPLVQKLVSVADYNLDSVPLTRQGDLSEPELARVMMEEKPLHGLARAAIEYSNFQHQSLPCVSRRPTLIYASSVEHSKLIASILNRWHAREGTGAAASIDCKTYTQDESREIVRRFRRGEYQYLVNYSILLEGVDIPEARVIVVGRPTKSRLLYAQMVGRITRPHETVVPALNAEPDPARRRAIIRASEKPAGLIVDMVGVSTRHKLVTCADLLGGIYRDEVVELAKAKITKMGVGRVDEALVQAQRDYEAQQLQKRRDVVVRATLSERDVDPFNVMDVPARREPAWHQGRKPTDKQLASLAKAGYPQKTLRELTFWQARCLLDGLAERRQKGQCTLKQAKKLQEHGLDPSVSFEEARRQLDQLASNGWRSL